MGATLAVSATTRGSNLALAWLQYGRLTRPSNALLPMIAVATGYTASGEQQWLQLCLAIVAVLLLHSFVTVWNDIEDAADDKHNNIHRIAELRRLSGRVLPLGQLVLLLLLVSIVVLVGQLYFALLCATYLGLGWLYNAEPVRLSKRPIGSITVLALAYGLLPFLLGACLGELTPPVWLLGFGWMMSRTSLSLLKDYKDAVGDTRSHKKTFLLVFGGRLTAWLSISFLLLGAGLVIAACYWRHASLSLLVVAIPIAGWLLFERGRLFGNHDYVQLNHIFHADLQYQLVFDVMILLWLRTV